MGDFSKTKMLVKSQNKIACVLTTSFGCFFFCHSASEYRRILRNYSLVLCDPKKRLVPCDTKKMLHVCLSVKVGARSSSRNTGGTEKKILVKIFQLSIG